MLPPPEAAGRVGILVQARLGSTRLPGKMLARLGETPLIEFVCRRLETVREADLLAVVTSSEPGDDALYDFCLTRGIPVFRGPHLDVLGRYRMACEGFGLDAAVRVCGDSPFVSRTGVAGIIRVLRAGGADYVRQVNAPAGFMSEGISLRALRTADAQAGEPWEREHVTPWIIAHLDQTRQAALDLGQPWNETCKLTIDHPEDLELARGLVHGLDLPQQTACAEIISRYRALILGQGRADASTTSEPR